MSMGLLYGRLYRLILVTILQLLGMFLAVFGRLLVTTVHVNLDFAPVHWLSARHRDGTGARALAATL